MTLGLLLLAAADVVLLTLRVRYGRDLARAQAALSRTERDRVEAIAESEVNRLAIAAELARREALGDQDLHLAVDTERSMLYLERQGARLREMRVLLGPEETVGLPPDAARLAPPRGKRTVARVVDGSYAWRVPEWVYIRRRLPLPGERSLPGALGPMAVFLDSGTVLYSRPLVGPLGDDEYVLPGSVRAEAPDLEAIRVNLVPGMAVYFH